MAESQLDFLMLLSGIPFLALAGACYTLSREAPGRVSWEWFSASACLLCLHLWMELAEVVSGGLHSGIAENLVLLLAYLSLVGYGLSQSLLRWRYHVLWYIAPAAMVCTAQLPQGEFAETLISGLLGLPACLIALLAVWRWAAAFDPSPRRLGRIFALLLPLIPLLELAFGASMRSDVSAGAHAAATYVGYLAVGCALTFVAGALDSILVLRDWGPGASRSNLVHSFVMGAVLLVLLLSGWLLTQHLTRLRHSELRATAQRRDVTIAERINVIGRTCEKVARVLASNSVIVQSFRLRSSAVPVLAENVLSDVGQAFQDLSVYVSDDRGQVRAADSDHLHIVGQSRAGQEYVRRALAGEASSTAILLEGGSRALVAAEPVRMGDQVVGTLVVASRLDTLEAAFPEKSNVMLVSPEGIVWLSSRPEWLFRRLWSGQPTTDPSLTEVEHPLRPGEIVRCGADAYLVNTQAASPPGWYVMSFSPMADVYRSRAIGLLTTGAASIVLMSLALAVRQRTESLVARHRRATLEQNMQQMEHLISVLSHDLRTPLAASRGITDYLLMDTQLTGEPREMIAQIGSEQMRMSDMVTRMLDAMRIRSGAMEWSWGDVEVPSVLRMARDTVHALPARSPGVDIQLHVAPEVGTMRGDAQSLRRLVENLATNAVRHTPQGSVRISADIAERARRQWLRICVQDSGEGMDDKTLSLLGRPFVLGGKKHGSGSGLGVGICSGICAAHGGWLEVRSRPGEGSTFIAWLKMDLPTPQRPEHEPAVQIVG